MPKISNHFNNRDSLKKLKRQYPSIIFFSSKVIIKELFTFLLLLLP